MGFNLKERTYLGYVVILRLWIGSYLLYQGSRKFLGDFPHSGWSERQIGKLSEVDLYPWYESFLASAVIPNEAFFGYLVQYGEILIGISLILGLLTRFSSALGVLMFANYVLGPGMVRGGATLGQCLTFLVAMVVLFLTNPGRTLGLDGFFKR